MKISLHLKLIGKTKFGIKNEDFTITAFNGVVFYVIIKVRPTKFSEIFVLVHVGVLVMLREVELSCSLETSLSGVSFIQSWVPIVRIFGFSLCNFIRIFFPEHFNCKRFGDGIDFGRFY